MKNQKNKLTLLSVLVVSGLLLGGCTNQDATDSTSTPSVVESLPERPAEVTGYVRSIEGNEIIIAREIKDPSLELTDEEKEAKKEERASLSPEERQAARESMVILETESLTLTIPVGVPILQSSGTADGTFIPAELADIKTDSYLSIWMNGEEVESVRLKGSN